MAGSKISDLVELNKVSGQESVPVIIGGQNFKVPVSRLKEGLSLTKSDVGLERVDNTADAEKPVSGPQQKALNEKADLLHSHSIANVKGLQAALDDKANVADVATKQDLQNIETELSGKADKSHTHAIADVEGLTDQFDSVAKHFSEISAEILAMENALAQKADLTHKHQISDVNGLSDALADRPTTEIMSGALLGKADVHHRHSADEIDGLTEIIPTPTVVFSEDDW